MPPRRGVKRVGVSPAGLDVRRFELASSKLIQLADCRHEAGRNVEPELRLAAAMVRDLKEQAKASLDRMESHILEELGIRLPVGNNEVPQAN